MKQEISDIITLFLAGESSAEDEMILNAWIAQSDENRAEFAKAERTWNSLEILLKKDQFDSGAAFKRFQATTTDQSRKNNASRLRVLLKTTARLAAMVIVLITTGAAATYLIKNYRDNLEAKIFELRTPAGSTSQITLSDGSTVWLNAGSRLTYSSCFGVKDRIVSLEGEGYFNVNKCEEHPFTVLTSELEIMAIGTSFNIKSYPDENIIQTTLVSGSLLVTRSQHKEKEKGLVLEPNQQITYFMGSEKIILTHAEDKARETHHVDEKEITGSKEPIVPRIILSRGIDTEKFTAWKENRLIFDDELFESIAVKLERRYGAKIIIKDEELRNIRFKGRFDEITIEQALNALQFASPFDFQIKQDTIYITKR